MIFGIGALVAVIGLFVGLGMLAKARNRAALSWPSVEGEVLVSEIHSKWTTDGQGKAVMRHTPDVQVRYVVDGQIFTGKRIAFYSRLIDTSAQAQAICDRYPSGGRVPVYYNPKKPADSVLERREH